MRDLSAYVPMNCMIPDTIWRHLSCMQLLPDTHFDSIQNKNGTGEGISGREKLQHLRFEIDPFCGLADLSSFSFSRFYFIVN